MKERFKNPQSNPLKHRTVHFKEAEKVVPHDRTIHKKWHHFILHHSTATQEVNLCHITKANPQAIRQSKKAREDYAQKPTKQEKAQAGQARLKVQKLISYNLARQEVQHTKQPKPNTAAKHILAAAQDLK